MGRPTVVVELKAGSRIARDLAVGGVFVRDCELAINEHCDLVVRAASDEIQLEARVVYIDGQGGAGLELVGFTAEMRQQLVELTEAPAGRRRTPAGSPSPLASSIADDINAALDTLDMEHLDPQAGQSEVELPTVRRVRTKERSVLPSLASEVALGIHERELDLPKAERTIRTADHRLRSVEVPVFDLEDDLPDPHASGRDPDDSVRGPDEAVRDSDDYVRGSDEAVRDSDDYVRGSDEAVRDSDDAAHFDDVAHFDGAGLGSNRDDARPSDDADQDLDDGLPDPHGVRDSNVAVRGADANVHGSDDAAWNTDVRTPDDNAEFPILSLDPLDDLAISVDEPRDAAETSAAEAAAQAGIADELESGTDEERKFARNMAERLRGLTLAEQIKKTQSPDPSERIMLERIYGKTVWEPLLRNPRLTPPEVARIARMGMLPRTMLEVIVGNGAWLQIPEVRRALLSNPRLGADQILRVLRLMPKHELKVASTTTAYPSAVRDVAKRLVKEK